MSCSLCNKPRYRRAWCNSHYLRWRRYGDPVLIALVAVAAPPV